MALTKIDDRGLKTPIDLLDNEKIRLGTGNDLEIFHDGNNSYLDNSTGYTVLDSVTGVFIKTNNEHAIDAFQDGAVKLYHNNSVKLETTSSGISVSGQLDVSGNANFDGGAVAINAGSNVMDFVDNFALRLGNSQDLAIFHNGTHSNITNTTGDLVLSSPNTIAIKSSGGSENMITAANNGAVELYHDNNKKLETTSTGATVTGDLEVTGGITSTSRTNRNLIINGAMTVAQRGTSSTAGGYCCVDRFTSFQNGLDEAPTYSQGDVTSGGAYNSGFRKSFKITNGNQTSAGADDHIVLEYRVEDQDLATSGWNYLSSSSNISFSFWVKSSVAQNFYFGFQSDNGSTYRYVMETGNLSANTWTKITKTISGNSNLVFNNDNGLGMYVNWHLFNGTNRTGTRPLDAWAAADNTTRTPDASSAWYLTDHATFEITGVQLEVSDVATDFEHLPYCDVIRKCLRYYYATRNDGTLGGINSYASGIFGFGLNDNIVGGGFRFPEPMRAAPSLTLIRPSDGAVNGSHLFRGVTNSNGGTDKSANSVQFVDVGRYSYMYMIHTGGDSVIQGGGYLYHIIASAEL